MTPDEYNEQILPTIEETYGNRCICDRPGIRKILSFNFEDYTLGPVACADTEILVQALVRESENYTGEHTDEGDCRYRCAACGTVLVEHYDDYSINMYRSYVEYEGRESVQGQYLVGFRCFDLADVEKIDDFTEAESIESYLAYLAS